MATLVLQTIGAVAGQFLGGPIGAAIGQTIGAVAGSAIDQRLFAPGGRDVTGPRLTSFAGIGSNEGAAIARVYGRARIGGQMIWATRFEETSATSRVGGKGGGGSSRQTTYDYSASFAIGLCEGAIGQVRRIWADGREIDQTRFNIRVHLGDEDQSPDSLIVAKEGAENAPAYRGLAYVVFERMQLAEFGNRIPQLSFEVVRPLGGLCDMVRAVDIIPGSGEFVYATAPRFNVLDLGGSSAENRHNLVAESDWVASLDQLQAACPNVRKASLVVSWFGDDLRAGNCRIAPRVESVDKVVAGETWNVAGLGRSSVAQSTRIDGRPAYGGTPSDASVLAAIADLKSRGLAVSFYPFVMMDVPADNNLVDPWTGASSQPAYPWRGRITCDPAPGRPQSVDASAIAGSQVASFFGARNPGFYEWSYRRFILHYAQLCANAGGVDAFLIGSELVGLTRIRSSSGVYPAVQELVALAADVKAILGPGVKVSYAADWTEYGAHVLNGGAEVRFPLDALWASPAIDAIGIDLWAPLGDWRDGDHLDAHAAASIYDLDYLRSRLGAGEAFDFYYSDRQARIAQARTPISDGAYGKPWTFRQKDLVGFWSNAHVERVNGVELSKPSPWVARSKPIWLTEIGCPAIDRGANAPHVFPDPKSSETGAPWFSRGFRDDLIQARTLEAILSRFDPALAGFEEAANPFSPIYGGRMVDPERIYVWAWDARPSPAFPTQEGAWSDGPQWRTGHWLNGRIDSVSLNRLLRELCLHVAEDCVSNVDAMIDGFVLERPMSPRAAIEQAAAFFGFDAAISGGKIRFDGIAAGAPLDLSLDDLTPREGGELVTLTRSQESEIPMRLAVTFIDGESDYRTATASSTRVDTRSRRESANEFAIVTTRAQAQRRCDIWLQDIWAARERASFAVRPGLLDLEVGDLVRLPQKGSESLYRIERITDGFTREIESRAIYPSTFEHIARDVSAPAAPRLRLPGPPLVRIIDLGFVRPDGFALQHIAVFSDPWPGPMAVWRAEGDGFAYLRSIEQPATMGETLDDLGVGVTSRFDRANTLLLRLASGTLNSVDPSQALAGRTALAIKGPKGWEALSFVFAEPVAERTWRLNKLVRGLGGEDWLAGEVIPAGAPVVLLDAGVVPLVTDVSLIGAPQIYRVAAASGGHGDPASVEVRAQASALALLPYAPVRPSARRVAGGVEIAFIRRGRIDSDGWTSVDVPLGEDLEAYEIEILKQGVVQRVVRVAGPQALYSGSHELEDFGSVQTLISLRIFQMSASVGRGFACEAIVSVA